MKNQMIFRVLMILGVIANIAVLCTFSGASKSEGAMQLDGPYTSQGAGFSLCYPKGWTVAENNTHGTDVEVRIKGPHGARISAMSSLAGSLMSDIAKATGGNSKESPIKPYHSMVLLSSQGNARDFEEAGTMQTTLNGKEAYVTSFKYRSWSGMMGRAMQGIVITTWNGESPVAFKLVAPVDDYERLLTTFNDIVTNFVPGTGKDM